MRYWLIGFDLEGNTRCGSDWTQASYKKTGRGRAGDATRFFRNHQKVQEVYCISESQYSQEVCEMSPKDFADYVKRVGNRVL